MPFYNNRAQLYDIAFSWDISEEVAWLLDRFGPDAKVILEPACGSGRTFPEFAKHGVEVVGVELAETMIKQAQNRMKQLDLPVPRIIHGDMTDFDFGQLFDGAFCPVNSFGYLLLEKAAQMHLACMARHLSPDSSYLVQIDLLNYDTVSTTIPEENSWIIELNDVKVRTTWSGRSFDAKSRLEVQVCRFEVLSGINAGIVTEDEQVLRRWDWDEWTTLINNSPFALVACYEGDTNEYTPLRLDRSVENRNLAWYELKLI